MEHYRSLNIPVLQMEYLCKLVVIGSPGVGKTSLIRHYVDREFTESYISTIGVDFRVKVVEIPQGNLRFQIWDTAGQERFRSITTSYYRGANVIVIVYDVTDRTGFNHVEYWLREIRQYGKNPLIYLVANKTDLSHQRVVLTEEGQNLAQREHLEFYEVSAKTGLTHLDTLFRDIAAKIVFTYADRLVLAERNPSKIPHSVVLTLRRDVAASTEKRKCLC